ncbi:fimbrillin family protein [Sphingobacterium sp.]|uniref:RCC1 domain-containing protein n=1 Tax=Sphingobacterium sp. TaxID=341027 RepID=UPI0031E451A9
MNRQKFLKCSTWILLPLFLLVITFSCRKDNDQAQTIKGGVAVIKMNLKGIDDGSGRDNQLQSNSISTTSASNFPSQKENSTEVARIPLEDDYYLIATATEGDLSSDNSAAQQLKASGGSVTVKNTKTITNGSKFRVLIYDDKNILVDQKVYTAGNTKPDDHKELQLEGGSTYKFIVYSYNTTEIPPAISASDPIVDVSGNKDLLYFTKQFTVSGETVNNLDIVFKHKYSKINLNINSEEIGPITKIQASFTPHYVSNSINLLTGMIDYDKTAVNLPIDNFTGINTTTLTASKLLATPTSVDSATLVIASLTAGATAQVNKTVKFAIRPGVETTIDFRVSRIATVNIQQVASGEFHTLAISAGGEVYGTGKKTNGSMGATKGYDYTTGFFGIGADQYFLSFRKLIGPTNIKRIAVGTESSFVLTNDGELYATGWGNSGQLGLGNTKKINSFTKVNFLGGTIKDVVAGFRSTYILTEDGQVFATGRNVSGQLGLGDVKDRNNFIKVNSLDTYNIVEIATGYDHTIVRTADGKVLGSGLDTRGQLSGIGDQTVFKEIPVKEKAKGISTGTNHSFVLGTSGKVYATGQNSEGQLGIGNTTDQKELIQVTSVNESVKLVRGFNSHSFILTTTGRLYGTGNNAEGQLGTGDNISSNKFSRTATLDKYFFTDILIGSGSRATIVTSTNGDIFGTGYNLGVLGIGSRPNVNTFRVLPLKLK